MKRVLYFICTLSLLSSCGSSSSSSSEAELSPKDLATKVTAEVVHSRDIPQQNTFTANVEAETVNNITPQTPLRIKKLYVEVGDHVTRGQKLVDMDSSNLVQVKIQLENNKIEFNRVDELYAVGGVSRSEWDTKKLAYDISLNNYKNLSENTSLISPISGIITARNYDNGDMSGSAPIYVVEQIRPVKLKVNISESLYTAVKRGMSVAVYLDVYGSEKFEGIVSLIYPTIDPQTRTFPVEVTINNNSERIRPGMFARVTLDHKTEHRVVVPDLAVTKQMGSGDRYIYVVKPDNTVSYQKVELGQRIDDSFEIIAGIEDGDMVVTSGHSRLNNGKKVTIVE